MDEKATIEGPKVEGSWHSECVELEQGSERFAIDFAGRNVFRKTETFGDAHCVNVTKTKNEKGIFRFIETFRDQGYTIEYNFDAGGGIHFFPQEKVWVIGDMLYLSDYYVGEAVTLSQSVAFKRR